MRGVTRKPTPSVPGTGTDGCTAHCPRSFLKQLDPSAAGETSLPSPRVSCLKTGCHADGGARTRLPAACGGGQPVTDGARGSAWAAARRAPKGAKAELPARSRRVSRGALAPAPAEQAVRNLARQAALSRGTTRQTAPGALRAPLKPYRYCSPVLGSVLESVRRRCAIERYACSESVVRGRTEMPTFRFQN